MRDQPDELADMLDELVAVARFVITPGTVENTLQQIVTAAVASIESCDMAVVHVVDDQRLRPLTASDAAVSTIDEAQLRHGEGPSLEAIRSGEAVYARDLGHDDRYPRFGPAARAAGVRSILACPLIVDHADGALTLCARLPEAFGAHDRAKAVILATVAGAALTAAADRRNADEHSANLVKALASREVIGQAQGILIERERITPEQAFDVLRRASQHLNRKLRDVAQDLVDTGEDPAV